MNIKNHIEFLKKRKVQLEYYLSELELVDRSRKAFEFQLKGVNKRLEDYEKNR